MLLLSTYFHNKDLSLKNRDLTVCSMKVSVVNSVRCKQCPLVEVPLFNILLSPRTGGLPNNVIAKHIFTLC